MTTVCIAAPNAGPAIFPTSEAKVGGMETRAWNLAKGFAEYTPVTPTIFLRSPSPLPNEKEGISIITEVHRFQNIRRRVSDSVRWTSTGPRVTRFRPSLLWQIPLLGITWPFRRRDPATTEPIPALRHTECDAYLTLGISRESARVVATASAIGRPSVVLLGANSDIVSPEANSNEYGQSFAVANEIFSRATTIVAQSEEQAARVRKIYSREAVIVNNPIDLRRWSFPAAEHRTGILWIGRADDFHKRPKLCLEIARQMPEHPFVMIMNDQIPSVAEEVRRTKPDNVQLIPFVPPDEMPARFRQAGVFLSTGAQKYEGFPNVLLQAAATGTPIVSMNDFGGFLNRSGAGIVSSESVSDTVQALKLVVNDRVTLSSVERVKEYLETHHDLSAVCRRLHEVITSAITESARRPMTGDR